MGNLAGSRKTAAKRIGISIDDYDLMVSNGLKWCTKCKSWKPINAFYKDSTRGSGLSAICVDCSTANTKYPGKRERNIKRAAGFAWCRFCATWLPSVEVKGGMCKMHRNEYSRKIYHERPAVNASRKQHSHSRKRGIDPIPVIGQEMILDDFDGLCAYCDNPATTWDHIVPISKGGITEPGNIVPACQTCNSSKKDSDVFEWAVATNRKIKYQVENRMCLIHESFPR